MTLTDAHAAHLLNVLRVTPGQTVRVGLLDGPLGVGTVESAGDGRVTMRCVFEKDTPPRPRIDVLLALPRPGTIRGRGRSADLRLLEAWLARDPIRAAMGVNTWEGTEWLDRDRFVTLLRRATRLDAIESRRDPDQRFVSRLGRAAEAAGYRVDDLLATLSRPSPARPRRH